ncbi:protein Churchill-like isoform X1 [Montipora foliosa]|uniref:protein Churchill-like isoform X1 n=1 Tax=Montipora foliosa TaxID=591990 RepID=UPI0035F18C06
MCRVCVKQELPQRGTICLESGSYLLNFASCKECGRREPLKVTDKVDEEDDDGEEMVTYKPDVCASCDHVVATHEYTFKVEGCYQEYTMTCLLCGTAADSVSILPNDPTENTNHIF